MRILQGLGRTFTILGMTMLLFVLFEVVGTSQITNRHQDALAKEFQRELDNPVVPTKFPVPREGGAIARIRIPKINVNAIVVEGVKLSDLKRGPGHYQGTPYPWERGSTGIAGHRTGWGQPFYNLNKLRRGDHIFLDTIHGNREYVVTGGDTVEPRDVYVLKGNPKSKSAVQLTLTTCTPRYTSLRRYIVWADLVPPAPAGTT